jgi:hypothetical protein
MAGHEDSDAEHKAHRRACKHRGLHEGLRS